MSDKTTEARPDSVLGGCPKEQPCGWCGASRSDQVRLSYSADDGTPLCESCWAKEYGDEFYSR
jgi:hypothetical protein